MKHRRLAAAVVGMGLALVPATAGSAATLVAKDRARDVEYLDFDSNQSSTRRWPLDIREMRIDYDASTQLEVIVTFANLRRKSWDAASLGIFIGPGTIADYWVSASNRMAPRLMRVKSGQATSCVPTFVADAAADTMTFTVPSDCLGAPESLRVDVLASYGGATPNLPASTKTASR